MNYGTLILWNSISYLKGLRSDVQLTLEQHRFELCGSTYTRSFFSKFSTCIFILQIFKLNVRESLCSIRDHNMWNQNNQGLSLDFIQTVSSSSCLWVSHLTIPRLEAERAVCRFFFTVWGSAPPKHPTFQGSTAYFRAKRFTRYCYMKKGTLKQTGYI